MDQVEKLDRYRALLRQTIERYARMDAELETSQMLAVCDQASDNYLLLDVGWDATGRRERQSKRQLLPERYADSGMEILKKSGEKK